MGRPRRRVVSLREAVGRPGGRAVWGRHVRQQTHRQTQETQERPLHSLDGFELQAGTPHRPDGAITPAMPHGFCAAAIGYGDTRWCGEDSLRHDCTVQLEGNGWLWSTCPGGELCVGPMQTVDGRCDAVPMWYFTIVKTEQQHGEPSRRDPMHLPARHLGCTRDKERVQSRPVQGASVSTLDVVATVVLIGHLPLHCRGCPAGPARSGRTWSPQNLGRREEASPTCR